MKPTFINPATIDRINRRVDRILRDTDSAIQRWQLFEMVAAIETGLSEHLFYRRSTLVCDGWNAYKTHDGGGDPDPYDAYGGFYRNDPSARAAFAIRVYANALKDNDIETATEKANDHATRIRLPRLIFESHPHVWGYSCWQSYYEEQPALDQLTIEQSDSRFRRGAVELCEQSGMYILRYETTRKPRRSAKHFQFYRTRILD